MLPATLQFLITMIACAINERMQRKLDYTQEEVRVLKDMLKAATVSDRIVFTAGQRRRLAVAGKALSPEERKKYCQIVKPGTLLGWFRQMAAQKYDSSKKKVGRPRKRKDIRKLVIAMALANLGWGYTKIRDALRTGLKIEIGRTTVANILLEEGIEPAPEREKKRTWRQFMKRHWETLYACDFFSVEALGPFGTVRYMVFFVIELKSRAVEIAGIAVDPGEAWMNQVARNLTDPVESIVRLSAVFPSQPGLPLSNLGAVRMVAFRCSAAEGDRGRGKRRPCCAGAWPMETCGHSPFGAVGGGDRDRICRSSAHGMYIDLLAGLSCTAGAGTGTTGAGTTALRQAAWAVVT
jgi:putative transposase